MATGLTGAPAPPVMRSAVAVSKKCPSAVGAARLGEVFGPPIPQHHAALA